MEYFSKKSLDLKRALKQLAKLNKVRYRNNPLSSFVLYGKYNVWHCFQVTLLFNELRTGKDAHTSFSLLGYCRVFLLHIFLAAYSFFSVVFLVISKRRVGVYSVDKVSSKTSRNDMRLESVYTFLDENSIKYVEFFHTIPSKTSIINIFKRLRPAIYLESIDFVFSILSFFHILKPEEKVKESDLIYPQNISKKEKELFEPIILSYLNRIPFFIFRVKILTKIIKLSNIKTLFTIDDVRNYYELILACKLNNIPTYAFQHGHFTKYHVGYLTNDSFSGEIIKPDVLYLWSEYWKDELKRLGTYFTDDELHVAAQEREVKSSQVGKINNKIRVLIPYESEIPREEVLHFIDALKNCSNIQLIFKVKPGVSKKEQLDEYNLTGDTSVLILEDMKEAIAQVDVAVGVYSTLLYDLIAYEKPIALLKTSSDYGEGMVANDLADWLNLENICFKIEALYKTPKEVTEKRKDRLFGSNKVLLKNVLESITYKNELK